MSHNHNNASSLNINDILPIPEDDRFVPTAGVSGRTCEDRFLGHVQPGVTVLW